MKGIFVVIDGLSDKENKFLENQTPLEAAYTPNMDFFAARGEMGFLYPVKPGFAPSTDEAILSIFGNDLSAGSRGQFEARAEGLSLTRGDLALRVNFATIDSLKNGNIIDRRAGRTLTDAEAESLVKAINKIPFTCSFDFEHTLHHRGVLVFKGGFSDNIIFNDLHYSGGKISDVDKISQCRPLDKDDNSQYTVNVLNEFLEKAYEVLNEHPVNKKRKEKGLLPANYLLLRGAGIEKPKVKQYKKWLSLNYMNFEKGFSELSGMKNFSFDYPVFKGIDSYDNFWQGLRKACMNSVKVLKKNHQDLDYAYIHIKETDIPGHDNKPLEKKNMIEYIDRTLFRFLRKFAPPKEIKVVVTSDHSTVCKFKKHTDEPVPVLFYNGAIPRQKKFNEKEARKGTLGRMEGHEILKKTGFVR